MRLREPSTVALLTDFGTRDVFVGVVKAIIARMAPSSRVIDLTHEVPPGDIRTGAFRLWQALPYLPPRAVVLAVVDPGVGTSRAAIAVSLGGVTVVCPDNGLLTYVLDCGDREDPGRSRRPGMRAFRIEPPAENRRMVSATFHGRDVFAPAAARLAAGARPADLGPPAAEVVGQPLPRLRVSEAPFSVRGEVLTADRFGNMVTSIGVLRRDEGAWSLKPWIPGCSPVSLPLRGLRAAVGDAREVPVAGTYADVPPGALLAYVGSDGLLEIGANGARAADLVGPLEGVEIVLRTPA